MLIHMMLCNVGRGATSAIRFDPNDVYITGNISSFVLCTCELMIMRKLNIVSASSSVVLLCN